MMGTTLEIPTAETSHDAVEALKALRPLGALELSKTVSVRIQAQPEISVEIPQHAVKLLFEILGQLANGNAVTVVPVHAELTTQQAADMLNVSRPFLVKLLDDHVIPHAMVCTHRRVKASDLIAYKRARDERSRSTVDELAALGQELGT